MCLAVPLRVARIIDLTRAVAGEEGSQIELDISLVPGVEVGDYVIVHAGFAMQIIEQDDAAERLDLFRQIAEAADPET